MFSNNNADRVDINTLIQISLQKLSETEPELVESKTDFNKLLSDNDTQYFLNVIEDIYVNNRLQETFPDIKQRIYPDDSSFVSNIKPEWSTLKKLGFHLMDIWLGNHPSVNGSESEETLFIYNAINKHSDEIVKAIQSRDINEINVCLIPLYVETLAFMVKNEIKNNEKQELTATRADGQSLAGPELIKAMLIGKGADPDKVNQFIQIIDKEKFSNFAFDAIRDYLATTKEDTETTMSKFGKMADKNVPPSAYHRIGELTVAWESLDNSLIINFENPVIKNNNPMIMIIDNVKGENISEVALAVSTLAQSKIFNRKEILQFTELYIKLGQNEKTFGADYDLSTDLIIKLSDLGLKTRDIYDIVKIVISSHNDNNNTPWNVGHIASQIIDEISNKVLSVNEINNLAKQYANKVKN